MKRFLRYAGSTLIAAALVGVLVVLYLKTQALDPAQRASVNGLLRDLKQLDADWNVDVLRSKTGLNKNYDPVTQPQRVALQLEETIASEGIGAVDPKVREAQAQLRKSLSTKVDLVDQFKAQNAILHNSVRFIPVAADEVKTKAREAEAAPAMRARMTTLRSGIEDVLVEALKLGSITDSDSIARVRQMLDPLVQARAEYPQAVGEAFDVFSNHMLMILTQKAREDDLLGQLNQLPVVAHVDALAIALEEAFERANGEREKYRVALVTYSGFLIALLGFLGWRLRVSYRALNKSNASLKEANENLETKVVERTENLSKALEDLKASESQLVQAEKMAALGQMVAGIAHEINTPLAYVRNGLELVQDRLPKMSEPLLESKKLLDALNSETQDQAAVGAQFARTQVMLEQVHDQQVVPELQTLLKDGLSGIDQISEIVVNLKNFSRIDRAKVSEFNVNEGLESTLLIAKNVVKPHTVKKLYGDDVPMIIGSPSQINQVFLNLINNAAQAIEGHGTITLRTTRDGDAVKIEVIDTGKGIADDVMPKIFDPFFTTKKVGEGTGLGLSIAQKIIKEHGGTITVTTKEGPGTNFCVRLPAEIRETALAAA